MPQAVLDVALAETSAERQIPSGPLAVEKLGKIGPFGKFAGVFLFFRASLIERGNFFG
jgi:hypothetical protein